MTYSRMTPDERATQILDAALALVARDGFANLTRGAVAERAKCSKALITIRFDSFEGLLRAVFKEAVRTENYPVIAQGLVSKKTFGVRVSPAVRAKALESLSA